MTAGTRIIGESGEKRVLTGNEAVARGVIEEGVKVATAYPGTPSSEIVGTLSRVAKEYGIYVEWSTNEKVAFEVAYAAALTGIRSFTAMKHLGANWALDPMIESAYTGVPGGFLIVFADDPYPHSSQNAEDTRYIAKLAKIPCIEPSDPGEAKDLISLGYRLSEKFETPVILRVTTRIAHSQGIVTFGKINKIEKTPTFKKDPERYVMIAPKARPRHVHLNRKIEEIKEELGHKQFYEWIDHGSRLGVIASGVSYSHVIDAIQRLGIQDKVDILKLRATYPIPERVIDEFIKSKEKLLVAEELEPIVEEQVFICSKRVNPELTIHGKLDGTLPRHGEYNIDIISQALSKLNGEGKNELSSSRRVESRIPSLCAGCPHRASYYAIRKALEKKGLKKKAVILGDRGCYNQGVHPPLKAIDTCICMGASIGMAHGLYKAGLEGPIIAVIGDGTFYHGGLPPLMNAVQHGSNIKIAIFDNKWTSMTGQQPNPGTGINAMGDPAESIDIESLVKACNVKFVRRVDPFNLDDAINAFYESLEHKGVSVVIFSHECALQEARRGIKRNKFRVIEDSCIGCKQCVSIGCPAIKFENGKAKIQIDKCVGCGLCAKICPVKAIAEVSK